MGCLKGEMFMFKRFGFFLNEASIAYNFGSTRDYGYEQYIRLEHVRK